MDIFPLIICMLSCQWAQPYWQPSMSDWRECDVFCAVSLAGESGHTAPVQHATGTAPGKVWAVSSHCHPRDRTRASQSREVPVSPRSRWPVMVAPTTDSSIKIHGLALGQLYWVSQTSPNSELSPGVGQKESAIPAPSRSLY